MTYLTSYVMGILHVWLWVLLPIPTRVRVFIRIGLNSRVQILSLRTPCPGLTSKG